MRKLKMLLSAGVLVLGMASFANATGSFGFDGIGDVDTDGKVGILDWLGTYSGTEDTNWEVVTSPYDFTGSWYYTAIAYEAGDTNATWELGTSGYTFTASPLTTGNFGAFDTVNFGSSNLVFTDTSETLDAHYLDIYNGSPFKLYRLLFDSNDLSYISTGYKLSKGTLIVGFDDVGGTDSDYDDIMVALKPVPEPTTVLMIGAGLLGLLGLRRKSRK